VFRTGAERQVPGESFSFAGSTVWSTMALGDILCMHVRRISPKLALGYSTHRQHGIPLLEIKSAGLLASPACASSNPRLEISRPFDVCRLGREVVEHRSLGMPQLVSCYLLSGWTPAVSGPRQIGHRGGGGAGLGQPSRGAG
jgi:hypothetical protein